MISTMWHFQERLKYNFLVRSTAWVCGSSIVGIAGSNPMDVYLLCVLCAVRERSLRRVDKSFREVLQRVVCLSVISKPQN